MEHKIEISRKVFEENFMIAKKAFVLNTSLEASACAAAFIGNNQPTSAEAMKEAKKILGKNASVLTTLGGGNCRQVVIATLAQSSDPESAMEKIKKIYKGLDKKFFKSDYLVLAATMIYRACNEKDYDKYIKRTREIYKLIRHDHPFITGSEDITNCVVMALTDVDPEVIAHNTEECFTALKKVFWGGNKIQYMACVASVFGGEPDDKAAEIRKAYELLKGEGVRFDSDAFGIVAAVGLLVREEDKKAICKRIRKLSDEMKTIRGMGAWGAGKRIRNILSCAIVLDAYTGGSDMGRSSVINSIISTIIAIEIAACAAAASAAASSASASC
ncbi:MAG: DUF4003 family protein [Clostridiales bacterium]|nr:DUF4003 family protein [Clostridiales bacterium]